MTAQEIADQYADSMSVDANKELKQDIRDAIDEAVAAEKSRWMAAIAEVRDRAEKGRRLSGLPNVEILTRGALSALAGVENMIGTPTTREPRAPSPPQSDGG